MTPKFKVWERISVPRILTNGDSWEKNIAEIWRYNDPSWMIFVVQVSYLNNSQWGKMRHLIVKKVSPAEVAKSGISGLFNSKYPTYKDRVWILKSCGKWKKVALEVFPTTDNLVDGANLYHFWELEKEDVIPFSINEVLEAPDSFDKTLDLADCSIEYSEKTGFFGRSHFKYLYLRRTDGKEFTWYQKQFAKNNIYSDDITAIELILDKAVKNDYVCLICLPYNFQLGFGL